MSKGDFRTALAERIAEIVEDHKLPYKDGGEGLRAPAVFEQFGPTANEDAAEVPCVIVSVGTVAQSIKDGEETRTAAVKLIVVTYSEDSEQGYRDAETLIEAIEIDLISDPWLGRSEAGAKYKLTGPWSSDTLATKGPTFGATLDCSGELTLIQCVVGPDGRALLEDV